MSRVFDASASWIPAQLKRPVREALDAGWTPGKDRIKAGGWFIYSPKKSEKFYIPITCKDPDNVAKKLRALISKAYLTETNAFEPDMARLPGTTDYLVSLSDNAILDGAIITPGPVPQIGCPDCDLGFSGWDAFAAHQGPCQERVRARLAAEQEAQVPEEEGIPSEGASQSVADSTEPPQSGTIGTKEEAPLASENTATPATKKKVRKGGYTWTHVEEPLHKLLYEAIRYNRRWKGETDSKWAKRLAQFIEEEGLLNTLVFEVDADANATHTLDLIRELLGEGVAEGGPGEEEIEQYEKELAEKDEKILELERKMNELREIFSMGSDLAKEKDK